jgi:hypothetical protein
VERRFDSRDECANFLRGALGSADGSGIPEQAISRWLEEFAGLCEREAPNNPEGFDIILGKKWVVRDEDLKLFSSFKDAMLALSPVGFVLHDLPLTTAMSLTFALSSALLNFGTFTGELDERQARILIIMKRAARPLAASEILDLLKPSLPKAWDGVYDEDSVGTALGKLSAFPTPGGPRAFVVQLKDGTWTTNGI